MDMSSLFEQFGVMTVLIVIVVLLLKFLTTTLTKQICELKEIIIKLIDKSNNMKDTIDSKWKED
jgi:hypothetical protein